MRLEEPLSLTVTLPNDQRAQVPEAVVRWSRGQEFAVETVKIEQHTQARLLHYVKKLVQEPSELNRSTRVAQLNYIALAMNELGYQRPLKNEFWHKVRDPFDPSIADESALRAVAKRPTSAHGVEISVGSEPLSFDSW